MHHRIRSHSCQITIAALIVLATSCSPEPATVETPIAMPLPAATATQEPTTSPGEIPQPTTTPDRPPSPPPAQEPVPTAPQVKPIEHIVESGDTLLGLAMAYNVPMAAIQLANDLGQDTGLVAGQVLAIPPSSEWPDASPFWVVITVETGNTLSQIAQEYDLTIAELLTTNHMHDGDLLHVGQTLVLPLDVPAELARVPDPTDTPVPAPTTAPNETHDEDLAAPAEPPKPTPTPVSPLPNDDAARWASDVFRLINEVRVQNGIPPYTYNALLEQAALLHGEDCRQRGYCNHTGSDGSNVRTRVTRVGYDAAGAAECIVYSSSPANAVAWWMDEVPPNDAHRRTLLSTWLTQIGIAVVPNGRGTYYFIADFGRPN